MTEDEKKTVQGLADILLGLPREFELNGRYFLIYPETLGRYYLLAPLYEELEISQEMLKVDPTLEILRTVEDKRMTACKIIAYCTCKTQDDFGAASAVMEKANYFNDNASIDDLAKLLLLVMSHDDVKGLQDSLGITKEHDLIKKVENAKDKTSSMTFCGKSVLGSLILPACEKLNMTPVQIIWDISYSLLQMLMSDAIVTEYLSDKERKRVHIPTDRTRINADSKEGMEQIMRMHWD